MPVEAEDESPASVDEDTARARSYEEQARNHSANGDYAAAVAALTEAIALAPSVGHYYYLRANARGRGGTRDEALDDYARAVALGFDSYGVFHDRALLFKRLGEIEEALADYHRAIERNPRSPESRNNRAMIYLQRGQLDEALEDLRVAVEHSAEAVTPNDGTYECSMAEVLCALERWDEAERAMRDAIAVDGKWLEYARSADELRGIRSRFA